MRTAVDNLGAVGLIEDKEPTALPPNAWTDLTNIRCVDRSITSFEGYESTAAITELPEALITVKSEGKTFICYCGNDTIYSVRAGVETAIGTGFGTQDTWDACVLGGVGIFNTFAENPQYWGGSDSVLPLPYDESGTSTCYWTDVGMRAKVIRAFRYHLFALNVEDCDGYNPRKVHWSHPADPGSIPITWDITKADYDAGTTELSQTPGAIVDALQLRDTLQIYKSDGIWSVTYTGRYSVNEPIFNFRVVTTAYGLYARNLVCDVDGRHFFVSDGDIYIYDGTNFRSIADERVRDYFFDNVSRSNRDKAFTVYYERRGEVWLCFPTSGNTSCNVALVWNSATNVWSRRNLPGVSTSTLGVVDRSSNWTYGGGQTWTYADGDGGGPYTYGTRWDTGLVSFQPYQYGTRWDDEITTYGAFDDDSPYRESLILGGTSALYEMDRTNLAAGSTEEKYAQRTHLDLGDKSDWHSVLRIYPRATGDAFRVRVGAVDVSAGSVTWGDYQTFTPGTDYKLDYRVTGRQHAIEFNSITDASWTVESYEVNYVPVGRR